jgi:CheY-like chemotaxis protein
MTNIVLIVEDNLASRVLYEQILSRLDVTTTSVEDGERAMTYLAENTPDLIILDILLPKLNGEAILDYVHTAPHLAETVVCVITAHPEYQSVMKLRPGDTFAIKPIDPPTLRELIRRSLNLD